jgi:division/cell wall cluster transcriptional repressor MraZ
MANEFLGTFSNSVNKQKWITIPAGFKKKFTPSSKQSVIITLGPKNVIAVFPLDNWAELINKLKKDPDRGPALLRNLRDFASPEQKMEANGRIKVDPELLKIAKITDKVIIKGDGNYISIWNPEKFEQQREQRIKEHYDTYDSIDYQI